MSVQISMRSRLMWPVFAMECSVDGIRTQRIYIISYPWLFVTNLSCFILSALWLGGGTTIPAHHPASTSPNQSPAKIRLGGLRAQSRIRRSCPVFVGEDPLRFSMITFAIRLPTIVGRSRVPSLCDSHPQVPRSLTCVNGIVRHQK